MDFSFEGMRKIIKIPFYHQLKGITWGDAFSCDAGPLLIGVLFLISCRFDKPLLDVVASINQSHPDYIFHIYNSTAIGLEEGNVTFYVSPHAACGDCGSSVLKVHDVVMHDGPMHEVRKKCL